MRRALVILVLLVSGCGNSFPNGSWTLDGAQAPVQDINSSTGSEHCGWEAAQFLSVRDAVGLPADSGSRARTYVRDPEGVVDPAPYLQREYDDAAELPADARFTGYENDGDELWLAPSTSDRYAYVVSDEGDRAEAWPYNRTLTGCD